MLYGMIIMPDWHYLCNLSSQVSLFDLIPDYIYPNHIIIKIFNCSWNKHKLRDRTYHQYAHTKYLIRSFIFEISCQICDVAIPILCHYR